MSEVVLVIYKVLVVELVLVQSSQMEFVSL